jgi:hypothetical protein
MLPYVLFLSIGVDPANRDFDTVDHLRSALPKSHVLDTTELPDAGHFLTKGLLTTKRPRLDLVDMVQ